MHGSAAHIGVSQGKLLANMQSSVAYCLQMSMLNFSIVELADDNPKRLTRNRKLFQTVCPYGPKILPSQFRRIKGLVVPC